MHPKACDGKTHEGGKKCLEERKARPSAPFKSNTWNTATSSHISIATAYSWAKIPGHLMVRAHQPHHNCSTTIPLCATALRNARIFSSGFSFVRSGHRTVRHTSPLRLFIRHDRCTTFTRATPPLFRVATSLQPKKGCWSPKRSTHQNAPSSPIY